MKKLILLSALVLSLISCETEPLPPTGVPQVTPTEAVQGVVPSWGIGQWYNYETERILDVADYGILTDLSGLTVPFADSYYFDDIPTLTVHDEHFKWVQKRNDDNGNGATNMGIITVYWVNTHSDIQKVRVEVNYNGTRHNMGYYTKL